MLHLHVHLNGLMKTYTQIALSIASEEFSSGASTNLTSINAEICTNLYGAGVCSGTGGCCCAVVLSAFWSLSEMMTEGCAVGVVCMLQEITTAESLGCQVTMHGKGDEWVGDVDSDCDVEIVGTERVVCSAPLG